MITRAATLMYAPMTMVLLDSMVITGPLTFNKLFEGGQIFLLKVEGGLVSKEDWIIYMVLYLNKFCLFRAVGDRIEPHKA